MIDKYIYRDDKTGTAYWIEDNQFMSAPLFVSREVDHDMKLAIGNWETWNHSQKIIQISNT